MKKYRILLAILLCVLMLFAIKVQAETVYLVDDAELLSSSEASEIEALLSDVSERQGMDIVIVTTDSTDGKNVMDYADDYYDYNGYRKDGVLLLVSMEDSDWWVSTTGYGITAVTDAGLGYMSDQFVPLLSDGAYAEAFEMYAELCDSFIAQAKNGDPFDVHNLPKEPFNVLRTLGFSVVIGLVAAWITTRTMKNKLKSVAQKAEANDYVAAGSMQLTVSRDLFLYSHLSRTERAQSSSGGSSTHTSSSGTTHGGGGGKF